MELHESKLVPIQAPQSILTNIIQVYNRDKNIDIKEFHNYVLQAAKECIQKCARKDYKPYWNEDLNNKHNELTTARTIADVAPSIETNTELKQANAKFIKARNEARRSSWMKKTASLNMETDSNKLWCLTKHLNDEENRHAKITLLQDRNMVHRKQAAYIFADTYKEANNIPVELHKQNYVRTEQRKITESDDVSTIINSPLSYEELTSALSKQAGFREHHCTEDQTTFLAQDIEDGFQHKKSKLSLYGSIYRTHLI